ncbi:MAG: TldD/PmbA family protein [Planctomycetota bacterium]
MPSDYESLGRIAIERASAAGASYSDLRIVEEKERSIAMRSGEPSELELRQSLGAGLRVLVGGAWGFAAAPDPSEALVGDLVDQAVRQASSGALSREHPVELAPLEPQSGTWRSDYEEDPFEVALDEQFALLGEVDRILRREHLIRRTDASMSFLRERTWIFSSEGSAVHQETLRSGAGYSATAVGQGQVQTRSYPAAFGGQYLQGGYEVVRSFDLIGHAERVRDEAVALLRAPPCPSGERDIVLGGSQLALQIHESVGHANEFDRILGFEVDLAGRSFATPEKRGSFRYGSPIVNFVADSTLEGGLATLGWDDDCVPAGRWHVVEEGILRNYFTNREFALRAGDQASTGANRAWGWRFPPQIRIPNLSLMPGEGSLENLIADTREGFFLDTVKTWSIDQMRLNFQFTCEIAREIKDGRLGRLYRNPTYQGITPRWWGSCDAICGPEEWVAWGVPNCGKGQPMQVAEMSHGCSPARFRGVSLFGA